MVLDLNVWRFNWDRSKAARSLKGENARNWHITTLSNGGCAAGPDTLNIKWTALFFKHPFPRTQSLLHVWGLEVAVANLPSLSLSRSDSSFSFSTVVDAARCHPESPLGSKGSVPQLLGVQFIQTTLWGQPSSGGALAAGAASAKATCPSEGSPPPTTGLMLGPLTLSQHQSSSWIQLRPLSRRSAELLLSLSTPAPAPTTLPQLLIPKALPINVLQAKLPQTPRESDTAPADYGTQ